MANVTPEDTTGYPAQNTFADWWSQHTGCLAVFWYEVLEREVAKRQWYKLYNA